MTTNIHLIPREVFTQVADHLDKKEVTVLTGARQTGKTTILYQLKEWLIKNRSVRESAIKLFNLDLISDLESVGNQSDFINYLREELIREKRLFIFIDEIQRIENPGKFLKGIYDLALPVKLIVTGSSSLEIKSKVFESLTGRKRVFHVHPFSFTEYLSCHNPELLELINEKSISSLNKNKIRGHLFEFLVYGGYPRVVLSKDNREKIQILNEIFSSYVEKDIVGFMRIKNPRAFSKLVALLGDQIGNLINIKEISNTLAMNFRTLENYLHALESTFVVGFLRPYFSNARKELTKMPKVFFADNGIRNMAARYFAPYAENRDRGKLLENYVYSSIINNREGEVNYWRTKDGAEVDFISRDYHGNVVPVEVRAAELKAPEIGKSFRAFIEKYAPANACIVNLSLEQTVRVNKTEIHFLLPFRLTKDFHLLR